MRFEIKNDPHPNGGAKEIWLRSIRIEAHFWRGVWKKRSHISGPDSIQDESSEVYNADSFIGAAEDCRDFAKELDVAALVFGQWDPASDATFVEIDGETVRFGRDE